MGLLSGKVALVTGGGRGIGEASAKKLAENGANIIVADINESNALSVADDIVQSGKNASAMFFDVADFSAIQDKINEANNIYGHIDILVNVAGIGASRPIEEISFEDWDRIMNINLKSMFFISQACFRIMKKQNYGRLVHISSVAGERGGLSADASYAVSKGGVLPMSKCFAMAGAKYNIISNAITPGNIITELGKTMSWSQQNPASFIPLGRFGEAEDIANAVLFLSSDLASYITGDTLRVNGGIYM